MLNRCVKQKRFLASANVNSSEISSETPSKFNYTWFVPVELITDKTRDKPHKIMLNATHNAR